MIFRVLMNPPFFTCLARGCQGSRGFEKPWDWVIIPLLHPATKAGNIMEHRKDIAIIGGGPGGYLAALRAAQLGKTVVLFEEDKIGGAGMNYGCIPPQYPPHPTKS